MEFSIDSLEICEELDSLSIHSERQDDQMSSGEATTISIMSQ